MTSPRSRGVSGRGGKTYSMERPVISWISFEVGVSATGRPVATVRPSLRTVIRSPISRISSSRWEM